MKFALYLGGTAALAFVAAVLNSVETIALSLALVPFAGFYATWKLYRWHQFYGTRFLWGLLLASVAANIASLPVAGIAVRRVILGPDAPAFPEGVFLLGGSLIILEGVFVYLVSRWSDLDTDLKRVRHGLEDESEGTNLPPEGHR